jgi:stage IV sporulation protein FB
MGKLSIIKSIYNKVRINPLLLFVAASAVFTGLFKEFIIMFLIIIIHEIGHLLAAAYYHFNIDKISLYPFGGYIKFNDKLNRSLREEFIVLISGPLLQIVFFVFMLFINYLELININTLNIIVNYHYSLLFFNLLPIFPLDGSKLINILLSKFIPFKQSHLLMIYISYAMLFIALVSFRYISLNIDIYLLLGHLLTKIIKEGKNHKNIFNRFLLERYLYHFDFKKLKIIKGRDLASMMRDKIHLFVIGGKEITEREMLRKRYGKR